MANKFIPVQMLEQDQTVKGILIALASNPKVKIKMGMRTAHDVFYLDYPRAKFVKEMRTWDEGITLDFCFSSCRQSILVG